MLFCAKRDLVETKRKACLASGSNNILSLMLYNAHTQDARAEWEDRWLSSEVGGPDFPRLKRSVLCIFASFKLAYSHRFNRNEFSTIPIALLRQTKAREVQHGISLEHGPTRSTSCGFHYPLAQSSLAHFSVHQEND